ncbi:metallophosphatase family protein [Oscillochloris sp. ZM17-4]|uniref:metallophosphoesterase family protein n=1 Tax=Oscillochloris sp. ZM17-4 TaxID=2866714 RepID=UPI001C72B76E|nr:metallophosphoesterase family protein [Oscillochloris sp. ZM17-4]MBX0330603.1 metallophosphatase family protein [Oscillochloris sp. ZM17-4]
MATITLLDTPPPPDRVVARIGLIADTHMPDRLPDLPEAIGVALGDVDLILHAGDVGELRVIDALSALAPVIAVHGNDDTLESQRELPYQQIISAGGLRLLLTHAHYPDRADELASRQDDSWVPKLDRRAAMARRAGAQIVVFGHTHVPMTVPWGGVLLINPGAVAPGTHFARALIASVARLTIRADGAVCVEHIDLADPRTTFAPPVDLEAGFRAAIAQVQASILAADMAPLAPGVANLFRPGGLGRADADTVRDVLRRLAYPCWAGERDLIARADLEAAMRRDLPADLWRRTIEIIGMS